ncbi:MAG: hypothetical protein HQL46_09045, partial [Gammaproteobacteria bacterium]|nr:hypothetical protein [Gammaproteobacteria bacterium]
MGSPTARKDQKEIMSSLQNAVTKQTNSNKPYGLNLSTLKSGLDILLETNLRDTLATLEQPVYLLCGDRDTLVPLAALQSVYKQRIANSLKCDIEIIHHAGHAPFISHSELCLCYLKKVING